MSLENRRLIMVAPNGARRTKNDHPAIPVTVEEIVHDCAKAEQAGANAVHAHVRDTEGKHILDSGLYRELLVELKRQTPGLVVQVTTEAVGHYSPEQQATLVIDILPDAVSVAVREMVPENGDASEAQRFYAAAREAGVAMQHILYDAADVKRLIQLQETGVIPADYGSHLYVLGRYTKDQQSDPADLVAFLAERGERKDIPFTMCAFGLGETASASAAFCLGGHARVGFENSLWHSDGALAKDNADRISTVSALRTVLGYDGRLSRDETLHILGRPKLF